MFTMTLTLKEKYGCSKHTSILYDEHFDILFSQHAQPSYAPDTFLYLYHIHLRDMQKISV